MDLKKAYGVVRRHILYNTLTECGIPMEPVRLLKIETHSRARIWKHLSDMFPSKNGLKQGGALSPLLVNFAVEYAIRRVQVSRDGLKLNGTHQLVV
jgi:hypothetical protein